MKCPNCGSENVHLIYNSSKRGFKGSDACCGYILMGPIGLLCGALGSGQKRTDEFWLCNNCGSRFKNKDIIKYNQSTPTAGYIEPAVNVSNSQPVLPESSGNYDPCAPKTVLTRTKPYSGGLSIESLLKRAELFLEDSEWEKAYEYSENAIDIDACCAKAYLLKFMAEYNISTEDKIPDECCNMIGQIYSLMDLENYKKAYRFGDEKIKHRLEEHSNRAVYAHAKMLEAKARFSYEYLEAAETFERISEYFDSMKHIEWCKEKYCEYEYDSACAVLAKASSDKEADNAKAAFIMLSDYKDSKEKAERCEEKKNELRYNAAVKMLDNAQNSEDIEHVRDIFKKLGDYKDSAEKAAYCDKIRNEINYDEACKILAKAKRVNDIDKAVGLFKQVQNHDDINKCLNECAIKQGKLQESFRKKCKIALICAASIIIILVIMSIVSGIKDKESADDTETIPESASVSTAGEITETTVVSEDSEKTETERTAETKKTTETTVSETAGQTENHFSMKEKFIEFDGGNIEYTEYTYYNVNEYEPLTEYINFSAKVKLDDYTDSEIAINDALNEIGNPPDAEKLINSKVPESFGYGMMSEHNQIRYVYAEDGLLFITTYYLWDGGSGLSSGILGDYNTYIFDIKTGKQLKVEWLFNDFNKVKQLVIEYADKYVKENIPYEVYSQDFYQEPYLDTLNKSTWYNDGDWDYDGKNFTVHYTALFSGYMYKETSVAIPIDVIRPYFASENERAASGEKNKLADIVGPVMFDDPYNRDFNADVNVSLADISKEKYQELIDDLEHCVDMAWAIGKESGASFNNEDKFLYDDTFGQNEYYAVDYSSADDIFEDARSCFTSNLITDENLKNKLFDGAYPSFGIWNFRIVWAKEYPNPSGIYDFENAGIVSYSETEAEVWVAYIHPIEWDFSVYIFNMARDDADDKWKIDRIREDWHYSDSLREIDIDGI